MGRPLVCVVSHELSPARSDLAGSSQQKIPDRDIFDPYVLDPFVDPAMNDARRAIDQRFQIPFGATDCVGLILAPLATPSTREKRRRGSVFGQ
ncbi:hypothetical protein Ms3S1_16590 [Methylosinus sp. 3S-1]